MQNIRTIYILVIQFPTKSIKSNFFSLQIAAPSNEKNLKIKFFPTRDEN